MLLSNMMIEGGFVERGSFGDLALLRGILVF